MQTGLLPLGGVLVIGDDKLDSSLLITNIDSVQCLADRDKFVVDTALFECRCHRAIDNDPRTCWFVFVQKKGRSDIRLSTCIFHFGYIFTACVAEKGVKYRGA